MTGAPTPPAPPAPPAPPESPVRRAFAEFERLVDQDAESRAARLRELHGEDPHLARQVEALLAADARESSLLDRPTRPAGTRDFHLDEPSASFGQIFGAYRTVSLLGRGGMGEVFLAERVDGQFEQRVALKLLKRGMDSEEILRRFLRERQILARLDHPNIARLLDGGVSEDGRPYFVLEHVDGRPIDEYCTTTGAGVEEILRLLVACCRAVDAAHRRLVVHRDLKPSNILVSAAGDVKLVDFGIAKVLQGDADTPDPTALTRAGAQVLTPRYAAPEQILGEPITTATDVYALGLVLYELLTGASPHERDSGNFAQILSHVSRETVERPSAALRRQTSVPNMPTAITRSARRLEGDIDTILLKALDREPSRRYPSAAAFGDDLERHLAGRPVLARPDTAGYRLRKFVRRHRGATSAAALALLAILAGLSTALWQAHVARGQARRAEAAQRFLTNVFLLSDPDRAKGERLTARDLLDRGAARVDEELAGQPELQAEMQTLLGHVYGQLSLHPQAQTLLEKALRTRERLLEPGDPELAESYRRLAQTHHRAAQYSAARPLFEKALALHEANRNPTAIASTLNDLGNLARAEGDLEKARELGERVVALRREHSPPSSPELAKALNNLGIVLWKLKENREAAKILGEALTVHRHNEGEISALVAGTEDNMAMVLREIGEHDAARPHSEAAVRIAEQIYKEPHPAHAAILNSAGFVAAGRGDVEAAAAFYRRAMEIYARTAAPEHPDTAYPYRNLGLLEQRRGDPRAALALYEKALVIRERAYGPQHIQVTSTLLDVAAANRLLGNYVACEQALRRAVAIHESINGREHPRTATALLGLGEALALQGRTREARAALEESLAIRRAKLPVGDPAIAEGEAAIAALPGVR